jgi:hypothetical protein
MTEPDLPDVPDGVDLPRGEAALVAATAQLRDQPPSPRAAEVAARVLDRALSSPRRAVVLETTDPLLQVSTVAVVAVLRAEATAALEGAAVRRVRLDVDGSTLRAVHVELVVQWGASIPHAADVTHAVSRTVVADLLGPGGAPGADDVEHHVHVSDVTLGDPDLVEPLDEDGAPA